MYCDHEEVYTVIKRYNNLLNPACNLIIIVFCCVQDHDVGRSTDVQFKTCEAYEIVKLSKQKVTMEVNPAYENIHPNN